MLYEVNDHPLDADCAEQSLHDTVGSAKTNLRALKDSYRRSGWTVTGALHRWYYTATKGDRVVSLYIREVEA